MDGFVKDFNIHVHPRSSFLLVWNVITVELSHEQEISDKLLIIFLKKTVVQNKP